MHELFCQTWMDQLGQKSQKYKRILCDRTERIQAGWIWFDLLIHHNQFSPVRRHSAPSVTRTTAQYHTCCQVFLLHSQLQVSAEDPACCQRFSFWTEENSSRTCPWIHRPGESEVKTQHQRLNKAADRHERIPSEDFSKAYLIGCCTLVSGFGHGCPEKKN